MFVMIVRRQLGSLSITEWFGTSLRVGIVLLIGLATFLGAVVAGFSPSAHGQDRLLTWHGPTMGTRYQVKLILPAEVEVSKEDLARDVDTTLGEINGQMSTYLPDSEVSRFNRAEADRWFDVSPETAFVVQEALRISRQSEDAYDITVGPLVRLWHFGHQVKKSSSPPTPPTAEAIEDVLRHIGSTKLQVRTDPPGLRKTDAKLEIDLSSIAKGYAVDRVARLLDDRELHNYMVEIGGEVRTGGVRGDGQPWQIGIERPDDNQRMIQRLAPLGNQSVATSGDYRIFFMNAGRRYSHLIDPRSGRPVAHSLASASVVADNCMEADALATTLLILGPDQGAVWARQHKIAAVFLFRRDGKIVEHTTPRFDQLSEKGIRNLLPKQPRSTPDRSPALAPKVSTSFFTPGLTLLLTVIVVAISLFGMAAGLLLNKRCLRGSCGGLAGLHDADGHVRCDACTHPAPDCQGQADRDRKSVRPNSSPFR